jgi:hypothetical protein
MGQYVPPAGRAAWCSTWSTSIRRSSRPTRAKRRPDGWIDAREAHAAAARGSASRRARGQTLLVSNAEAALFVSRLPVGLGARRVLGNGSMRTRSIPPRGPTPALTDAARTSSSPADGLQAQRRCGLARDRADHAANPPRSSAAQFHAVGRAPAPSCSPATASNGARVWGEVPDMRPFLARLDVVLRRSTSRAGAEQGARGDGDGPPVCCLGAAAIGLPGRTACILAVADSDEALVQRALATAGASGAAEAMGEAARRLVVETMSWPRCWLAAAHDRPLRHPQSRARCRLSSLTLRAAWSRCARGWRRPLCGWRSPGSR